MRYIVYAFMSLRRFCAVHASRFSDTSYINPCLNLEKYLEIPLFKKNENCFVPTFEAMKLAEDIFIPKPGHNIKIIANTIHPENFPADDTPEVAVLGRSNVGKSSLLKSIFENVPHLRIKTSKNPGLTKSLQFFQVGSKLCIVDMPGYGFNQPKWFESAVGWYLQNRKNLVKTFLLIDCQTGCLSSDERAIEMLEEFRIPFALVMTKIDKATDSQRLKNLLHLRAVKNQFTSVCCFPQLFMLSSHSFEGFGYFLSFIAHITGNLNVENHDDI